MTSNITNASEAHGITVKGITLQFFKVGACVTLVFGGTTTEEIAANDTIYSLTGPLQNYNHTDVLIVNGQRCIIDASLHTVRFGSIVTNGTTIRGSIMYFSTNLDPISS